MTKKELKQLIKPMVKEVMLEVFTELHLDKIISDSVSRSFGKLNLVQESAPRQQLPRQQMKDPVIEQQLLEKRRKMLDAMHAPTKPVTRPAPKAEPTILTEMLEDTVSSGFEIQDAGEGNTNPEFVTEDTLNELTAGMDFGKFI